jgi:hypothetical protein
VKTLQEMKKKMGELGRRAEGEKKERRMLFQILDK